MIANIGYGTIIISLVISIVAIATAVLGEKSASAAMLKASRRASLVTFPLLTVSIIALLILLIGRHFEYVYVYKTTDISMPLYLRAAALWGGQEGSLLFWCWLLSGFGFIAMLKAKEKSLLPWVTVAVNFTLAFFLALVLFLENPFERFFINMNGDIIESFFPVMNTLQAMPENGLGLNPLLRHFGMVVHPPMLYLGFVGFVIPFAYAIAALVKGRSDDRWIRSTRSWSLVAWLFLSIGLILGSRWAYDVLGWGGYWGWDAVEISAFLPWLTGTAYLHSIMMQEKRGLFKHWNIALIILTFCLVIFGTFLTRSGLLSSVHAFSQSAIGPAFFIFISIMFLVSLGLLLFPLVQPGQQLPDRLLFFPGVSLSFQQPALHGNLPHLPDRCALPHLFRITHRGPGHGWTSILREGNWTAFRRPATVDGCSAAFRLGSPHRAQPGQTGVETYCRYCAGHSRCFPPGCTILGSAAGHLCRIPGAAGYHF